MQITNDLILYSILTLYKNGIPENTNLQDATSDKILSFVTKKWIEVRDQSGSAEDKYKPSKEIRFKTSILRSDICNYIDAYIVVKGEITVAEPNNEAYDKKLAFKNNAHFIS